MAKTVAKSSAPEAALSRAALEAVEDGDRARLDLAALISGAEASDFTFSILRPPVHGTASIKGQVLRFNPGSAFQSLSAGETHSEVIRVEAVSASGTRLVTSIQLSVTGRNDAPVLAQARVTLAEDDGRQMVDLADLTQDPDLDDAGQHSYEILRAPQAGTARINGSNLIFKPGAAFQQLGEGESQTVTVKVRVTDAHGDSTISKITLRVVGENDAPDMARGKMEADGDGPMVRLDLAAITEDVDGDALRFAIAGKPAEGVATLNGSILRFNPKADFLDLGSGQSRDVKIRIEVTDAQGAVDQAVVVVRVTGTNEAPTFSASALRTTEDGPVFRLDLSELSGDPDGGALVYAIHRAPSEGIASIRGSTLRFNPADDFQDLGEGETRDVKIRVTATDSDGASVTRTITVTVTGQDDQPVLQDGVLRATEDGPQVTLDLGSIIHDPDATSPVSFAVAGALPEGSAWINASNQLVFDPGDGFQDLAKGEKREIDVPVIAYLDGTVVSVSTVTVKVTGRNDAPTLKNGGLVLDETEQTLSLDLAAIASDVDRLDAQGGFSFELLTAPWNGISRIEDGVFYFDRADHYDYLPGGEREYHSLVFEITDVHGATGYGQYDLNVVGRDVAPRPVDGWDIHYVKDGSATEIDIAPAFFDPDSGPLSYSVVTRPEAGRITRDGSVLTFLPGSDFDDLADGETRSVFVDVRAKDGTGPSPTKRLELRMVGGETESIPGVGFALQGTHGGDTYNVAGDVNADGIVDFFAGFSQEKGVSGQIVEAFSEVLVSGRDLAAGHPFPASFAPDLEDGVTVLTGEGIETYPAATRALGDVNGDGVDDVLLW
ncbi:MAG: Ig-like domain-containing protein, partial [Pseudomonadota bacterium]